MKKTIFLILALTACQVAMFLASSLAIADQVTTEGPINAQPKNVTVPLNTLNQIIVYLGTRPASETYHLMLLINTTTKVVEKKADKKKAKKKAKKKKKPKKKAKSKR